MAYNKDYMTYAVVAYAKDHPAGPLTWNNIAEWVNTEENWKKHPLLKELAGINPYQFYRPRTKKGKESYLECKTRFDEINKQRAFAKTDGWPQLMKIHPGRFAELSYSQQEQGIREMQSLYREVRKELDDKRLKEYQDQLDIEHIEHIEEQIADIEAVVQKQIKKFDKQYEYIINKLNEFSAQQEMEAFGITADGIDHLQFKEALTTSLDRIGEIKRNIYSYKRSRKMREQKGEDSENTVTEMNPRRRSKVSSIFESVVSHEKETTSE